MSKTIILDLDGVTADWLTSFQSYICYCTGKPLAQLTTPQSWEFWTQWGLSEEEFWRWFEKFEETNGYIKCPQVRGAKDGVKALLRSGLRLNVVTSRGCNTKLSLSSQAQAKIDTVLWLRDYGITHSALHFTADKSTLPGDILLDDATHHLEAWRATGRRAICFNQSWNQGWDGERVSDWREAVAKIMES